MIEGVKVDAIHRPSLGTRTRSATCPVSQLRAALRLLVVLLVAEVVYILLCSPLLAVRRVTVVGDSRIAAEVIDVIDLPANSNIIWAPLTLVREQADAVPAVRTAKVKRALPNRLIVTLERREPIGVIRGSSEAVLVDPEGVVFTVSEEWGWGLPELVGPRTASGDVASKEAKAELKMTLDVVQALGPDPCLRQTRVQVTRDGEVEMTLESGPVVNLGAGGDLMTKVKLLRATLDQIGVHRIERIDLANPATAYWEPCELRKSG